MGELTERPGYQSLNHAAFDTYCQSKEWGYNLGRYRLLRDTGAIHYAVVVQDLNVPEHFVQADEAVLNVALAQAINRMEDLKREVAQDDPSVLTTEDVPPAFVSETEYGEPIL